MPTKAAYHCDILIGLIIAQLQPATLERIAAADSVRSPVDTCTMRGDLANVPPAEEVPELNDRQISLGLRNTATLASGQFSFAIFFGQGATSSGDRPFIQLTTCE
jgi:hypothetical protein